ncbi:MAG: type II toxin-antitoxin system HicA family toxin [Candidatus Omnitrophica bacterium]|nr:type II toxin-antitoxin system HicA family toxin [Candidatus Omnitrophota bacterium]
MPKLPVISYKELIKLLKHLGYKIDHQRGSHIRLKKQLPSGYHSITVPAHKEIAKGTLCDIIDRVSHYANLSKEQLIEKLKNIS